MSETTPSRAIVLRVKHRRLNGKGFGCYFAGSARRGEAVIVVDCDALAFSVAEHSDEPFRRTFIETLGHEFMHAIEDLMGVAFDEELIETAIAKYRALEPSHGR